MRRIIFGLAPLFLLMAVAVPARACINDREVNRSEREFKSQYQQPAGEASPQPSPPQGQGLSVALLGGGTALLLGATVTALSMRPRPQ